MRTIPNELIDRIANYFIDPKLKGGRDYPDELIQLLRLFVGGPEALAIKFFPANDMRANTDFSLEVKLVEKTFRDFFLNRSNVMKYEISYKLPEYDPKKYKTFDDFKADYERERTKLKRRYPNDVRKSRERASKETGPCSPRVISQCVNRINTKLKNFNPQIIFRTSDGRYEIDPTFPMWSMGKTLTKRPGKGALFAWAWLAKVVNGLDPRLVHQCGYCKKIMISRQIKKYHPPCRSKHFQELYGKEGRNAERQRQYRLRKNKKTKTRKTA
jgi:hypothetical protein